MIFQSSPLSFWQPRSAAAHPWLRAVVTTRTGGASGAPFDSLNLGLATGDAPERVQENRARVQRALGVAPGRGLVAFFASTCHTADIGGHVDLEGVFQ